MYKYEKSALYSYLGEDLVDVLRRHKCYVAGGAITSIFTNSEINDIDIYFRDKDSLARFIIEQGLMGNGRYSSLSRYTVVSVTDKATLMYSGGAEESKIQLIHFKFFDSPDEIFDTFDFTVCMGCFDFKEEKFVLHNDFLRHNSQRVLRFNSNTAFPIMSLLRVDKYRKKGYEISKPELVRILLTCMELEISSVEELEEQLGGMYGVNYDKMLEGIDKDNFSISGVIDKLQNLSLSDDYFTEPNRVKKVSIESVMDKVFSNDIKYFKHDGVIYKVGYAGIYGKANKIPKGGKEISAEEYLKGLRLYKYVKKEKGKYLSYFDNSFEYKIGETVKARGSEPRLYFMQKYNLPNSSYYHQDDRVVLEARIEDISDFAGLSSFGFGVSGAILLKKCSVIREVDEEELN